MDEEVNTAAEALPAGQDFAQDIARYFKAFLETGLRADVQPRRQSTVDRLHGLPRQLYLDTYPQLHKNVYKNVIAGLAQQVFVVSQNKYMKHSDERLHAELARAVVSLDKTRLGQLSAVIARAVDALRVQFPNDTDGYRAALPGVVQAALSAELVLPLIRIGYDATALEQDELMMPLARTTTAALFGAFEADFIAVGTQYFTAREDVSWLTAELKTVLTPPAVRQVFDDVLEAYGSSDAYQDLYQLHLANQVVETTDMYLYFGEIALRDAAFPIFYVPVRTSHSYPSITLEFGNEVFVNIPALQYALQVYAQITGLQLRLPDTIPERISLDDIRRKDALRMMQEILDQVADVYGSMQQLRLENAAAQSVGSAVRLTNRLQVALFDTQQHGLVADYDAILQRTTSNEAKAFQEFFTNYTLQSPVKYIEEVQEEWRAKTLPERVVHLSPLPLSDEQQYARLALAKKDTAVVVVEGAPGTGKSHLAASMVVDGLIAGKTSLVLSRSRASLDAIETTISGVLASARPGGSYHNPLLRLDAPREPLLEALEQPVLDRLQRYHQTYTKLQGELVTAKNHKIEAAAEAITAQLQQAENINLQEVEQTVTNELRFAQRDWVRDEPIDAISPAMQQLHQAVAYIRSSESNYLLPYIEQSQQEAIGAFITAVREYERANKNVNHREPQFITEFRRLSEEQKAALQSALAYVHSNYRQYTRMFSDDPITAPLGISDNSAYETIVQQRTVLEQLVDVAQDARRFVRGDKARTAQVIEQLISYNVLPDTLIAALTNYIEQVISLKSKIFGFSGRTLVVENLTRQLVKSVPEFSLPEPEKHLDDLQKMVDVSEFISEQLLRLGVGQESWKQVLHLLLADPSRVKQLQKMFSALAEPAIIPAVRTYRLYEADNLLANISLLDYATELNRILKTHTGLAALFGIKSIGQVLAQPQLFRSRFDKLAADLDDVKQLDETKQIVKTFIKQFPAAAKRLGIQYAAGTLDVTNDTFAESSIDDVKEYLAYKKKEQDLVAHFKALTADEYQSAMTELRQIIATQLGHVIDARLLSFAQNQKDRFTSLRQLLKQTTKLTAENLKDAQQVYPVILGDSRRYANHLPFAKNSFDLLVIDEASGVTLAEALPALLRAKQVVILGEGDEWTGQSAETIDHTINDVYRDKIALRLVENLHQMPADTKNAHMKQVREYVDVTRSLLHFGRHIANSEVRLSNYTRSSSELVSYVNDTFYSGSLKCLQARVLPLQESIVFTQLGKAAPSSFGLHTNLAEVSRIIEILAELQDADYQGTIGIVTPFYEQAAFIQQELDQAVVGDWFTQRGLEVLTFATSSGHSFDYVLYSMVASPAFDGYSHLGLGAGGQLAANERRQLIDAFSLARQTVNFVLSQPARAFSGAIGTLLGHFEHVQVPVLPKQGNVSDILMAADTLFPQYFYATSFYKKYSDKARLVSQFSLASLVGPLLPQQEYPSYKVDFLVTLGDHRLIISYDEFKEQFLSEHLKNADLYTTYLSAQDAYAQRLLENYGYTFLRFNRFNLGTKPVEVLDQHLSAATKTIAWPKSNGFLE